MSVCKGKQGSRVGSSCVGLVWGPHVGTASVQMIVGIATSDLSPNWICGARRAQSLKDGKQLS